MPSERPHESTNNVLDAGSGLHFATALAFGGPLPLEGDKLGSL